MRTSLVTTAAILSLLKPIQAELHQLFVGTYSTDFIYTIQFDDEAKSLSLLQNNTAQAGSSWIALSHDKKNLYGNDYNTGPHFYSYAVNNATSLTYDKTLSLNCSATMSISVLPLSIEPYTVYGSAWGGDASCGAVMSVDSTGALDEVVQNFTYSSSSGIHGTAFNPNETYLYSADDSGDSVWTHEIDSSTGEVTAIQQLEAASGADPRHIAVHPDGLYAYVVMEAINTLAVYTIDQSTHKLLDTNISYSLIASSANVSNYKASDVVVSATGSYVWATTRGSGSTIPGYISGYKTSSNGSIESQVFVQETSTSQGFSGSVTPSKETDQWFALTDTIEGLVQMYEWDGTTAEVVATVDLYDGGGCCSNVVWYS